MINLDYQKKIPESEVKPYDPIKIVTKGNKTHYIGTGIHTERVMRTTPNDKFMTKLLNLLTDKHIDIVIYNNGKEVHRVSEFIYNNEGLDEKYLVVHPDGTYALGNAKPNFGEYVSQFKPKYTLYDQNNKVTAKYAYKTFPNGMSITADAEPLRTPSVSIHNKNGKIVDNYRGWPSGLTVAQNGAYSIDSEASNEKVFLKEETFSVSSKTSIEDIVSALQNMSTKDREQNRDMINGMKKDIDTLNIETSRNVVQIKKAYTVFDEMSKMTDNSIEKYNGTVSEFKKNPTYDNHVAIDNASDNVFVSPKEAFNSLLTKNNNTSAVKANNKAKDMGMDMYLT